MCSPRWICTAQMPGYNSLTSSDILFGASIQLIKLSSVPGSWGSSVTNSHFQRTSKSSMNLGHQVTPHIRALAFPGSLWCFSTRTAYTHRRAIEGRGHLVGRWGSQSRCAMLSCCFWAIGLFAATDLCLEPAGVKRYKKPVTRLAWGFLPQDAVGDVHCLGVPSHASPSFRTYQGSQYPGS